ncbi:MAG: DUF4349 domain-containing protein [Candidatus Curtissbacteria bacterium]|nr:DUF4349 domain-containing protein [Candidatus Curtissbacteria bacterium]
MSKLRGFIGKNKLVIILLLVVGYLLVNGNLLSTAPTVSKSTPSISRPTMDRSAPMAGVLQQESLPKNAPAPSDRQDRLTIKETSLSLVVGDVSKVLDDINKKAGDLGGFLAESKLDVGEGATSGTIVVRVPEARRQEAIGEFKKMAVKVVSESVTGYDVTDEYVDLNARLAVLEKTKAKFEAILAGAGNVQDLLDVQRELVNIQSDIDSVRGQQKYLEQSAKLALVTVYLSTDELSLPYTPDQAWRPSVVFKQATRSLIGTARALGGVVIWVAVFTPIWLPAIIIVRLIKRRKP